MDLTIHNLLMGAKLNLRDKCNDARFTQISAAVTRELEAADATPKQFEDEQDYQIAIKKEVSKAKTNQERRIQSHPGRN